MDTRLLECRSGQQSTEYILPFFWQHGEDHDILKEEIDAIEKAGIKEFCVESRPHNGFCREAWWSDLGFMLEEAKKRGMRVWVLDDRKFPTGSANGYLVNHPELKKLLLRVRYIDVAGPRFETALIAEKLEEGEKFVSVVAYQRKNDGAVLYGEGIQLLDKIEDGLLWWDIPEGIWRVYYIVSTRKSSCREFYVDKLSAESCKAMIEAVYQPHYDHFAEYFGNTLAGFFSDEPGFANDSGSYWSMLGKEGMLIPWSESLPQIIAKKSGKSVDEVLKLLPALWHEIDGRTCTLREPYMDAASKAYGENFCWMLGDWCRAHNVMYIGHVIEDMNAHQRLGYGPGHFFRALDGQDMAGIDVVLNQIIPGHLDLVHAANVSSKVVSPEFFNYTLAKLASSHSHIQPLKKNRAMCELYGAFGWAEGIPMMKYLTDHMLVNGINYFVPHAFTPKENDPDCPPHFYARGMNYQYPLFADLMGYTARMAHILTGGVHRAGVAVYYNAEAEWAGGKCMLQQEVCKKLTRGLVDFDLIPQDVICNGATVKDGKLAVNEETYGALIVPYSQYLPENVVSAFGKLADEGVKVWFVNDYPEMTSQLQPVADKLSKCEAVPFDGIVEKAASLGLRGLETDKEVNSLRFYHINREGNDVFMLWNEDIFNEIDTFITLPVNGKTVFYDAWKNEEYKPCIENGKIRVRLAPSAATVICVVDYSDDVPCYDYRDCELKDISLKWDISLRCAKQETFEPFKKGADVGNLAKELRTFGGVLRYETKLTVDKKADINVIDLGDVGETAQLWVNGIDCGALVSAPFRFNVSKALNDGENEIRVEVMSNLAYREMDDISRTLPLPPTGIVGPVKIG